MYSSTFGKPAAAAATKAVGAVAAAPTRAVSAFMPAGASTWLRKGVEYTFFISSFLLVLYLILLAIHYFAYPIFAFGPEEEGIVRIPSASGKQVAFPAALAVYDRSCNFKGLFPYNTTFSLDVKLSGDFTTTLPRVLWYRSTNPITMAGTDTEAALQTRFGASNVVLYFDPALNDLKAQVITNDGTTTQVKTETCIENVPLGKPFRLTMVLQKRVVEIYMDGTLYKTIQTGADLIQTPVDANVFGPPNRVAAFVQASNIVYWPYVISPKMIRLYAEEPINNTIFANQ
jgi:hypothetical protein